MNYLSLKGKKLKRYSYEILQEAISLAIFNHSSEKAMLYFDILSDAYLQSKKEDKREYE